MLTRLRIKNFKAWGDQLWGEGIELAPITLFLGTNSVGKTSLLQPLLLLRQTFGSTDRSLDLYLGGKKGDLLDLGIYEQIIHGHDTGREMGFGLEIAPVYRDVFDQGSAMSGLSDISAYMEIVGPMQYEVTYGHASGSLHLKHLKMAHGDLTLTIRRSNKGAYRLTAPGYNPPRDAAGKAIPKREYKPEKSLILSEPCRQAVGAFQLGTDSLSLAISNTIEKIQYLGPLREPPRPTYLWGGQEPGEIGPRGEDAVPALLANLNTGKKAERGAMVREVSRWLKAMGVADALTLQPVGGSSRHYEVMVTTGSQKANLVHVGFGVSQVLPMIVLALTAPEGSIILAEQPEIHLHPHAQTALANLMAEKAKERHLQFLVETHSEHLFRRLQVLVADETLKRGECRLYFVDRRSTGAPCLEKLVMDDFGRIENWPKDFFGDTIGETGRQMREMIRRLKERGPQ